MAVSQAHFASASLYVGDLHKDVTESMLYEVFNSVGPVASIRVCRDSSSRRSLGYAYVNYHSVSDAERALDTLNYTHIKNVPCRIMWSHRDPALRKSGAGNVFVKNLDKDIDNKALYDTFSLFGNILSCKVAQDECGKSRGFGFVHYETEEAATMAIERVNGMKIGRKMVYVGPFKKRNERSTETDDDEVKYTNIYVKNIPLEWDEPKIKELFDQFGEVTSVALQADNLGRKFGFVNFAGPEAAKAAVCNLHRKKVGTTPPTAEDSVDEEGKLKSENTEEEEKKEKSTEEGGDDLTERTTTAEGDDGEKTQIQSGGEAPNGDPHDPQRLYVTRFQSRAERVALLKTKFDASNKQRQKRQGVNLYIKNLDDSVDDEALRELFDPFGTITSAKVMVDEKEGSKPGVAGGAPSRGFGFVSFLAPAEATKAVTEMHLKIVEGKPLYVGLAEKREDRIQRLQQKLRVPLHQMRPRMPQGMPPQIHFGSGGGVAGGMPPHQMYYSTGGQGGMPPPAGSVGLYPMGVPGQGGMGGRMPPGSGGVYSQMGGPGGAGGMAAWSRGPGGPPGAGGVPRGFGPGGPQGSGVQGSGYGAFSAGAVTAGAPPTSQSASVTDPSGAQNLAAAAAAGMGGLPRGGGPPGGRPMSGGPVSVMQSFGMGGAQMAGGRIGREGEMHGAPGGGAMWSAGGGAAGQMIPGGGHMMQGPHGVSQNGGGMPPLSMHHPIHMGIGGEGGVGHHGGGGGGGVNPDVLSNASSAVQKQMLGEKLFPQIARLQPELAGKITGMMLDMDNSELLMLLDSEAQLKDKVDEALRVLRHAGSNSTTTAPLTLSGTATSTAQQIQSQPPAIAAVGGGQGLASAPQPVAL